MEAGNGTGEVRSWVALAGAMRGHAAKALVYEPIYEWINGMGVVTLRPGPGRSVRVISGRTTLIAHIGYPTEAFKAPMIYNPFFEKAGIDAVVMPMGVKPTTTRLPARVVQTSPTSAARW